MKLSELNNRTAVITGAGKGIGFALARHAASLGMHVVIVDFDQTALDAAEQALRSQGAKVSCLLTDVSQETAVFQMADQVIQEWGVPALVFNNAGVGGYLGPIWALSTKKLQWVMEVNYWSIVHSIRAFIPAMLAQQQPCHLINTASMAGLYTFPYFASYVISKHSVIALSECLYHDLQRANGSHVSHGSQENHVGVSVLCPGGVKTDILKNSKHYPDATKDIDYLQAYDDRDANFIRNFSREVRKGMSPDKVAQLTFQAISEKKFYIFTHPDLKVMVTQREHAIQNEREPDLLTI